MLQWSTAHHWCLSLLLLNPEPWKVQEDRYGVAQLTDPGIPTILQTLLAAVSALKAAASLPEWRSGGGGGGLSNGGAILRCGVHPALSRH